MLLIRHGRMILPGSCGPTSKGVIEIGGIQGSLGAQLGTAKRGPWPQNAGNRQLRPTSRGICTKKLGTQGALRLGLLGSSQPLGSTMIVTSGVMPARTLIATL